MKILIVMDPGILVPPMGYGGHERLVYMFATEYVKLGHEVHLLVTKGSAVEGCIIHEIGAEGFPPRKWQVVLALFTAWKFLWRNRNEFDIVHNFGRLAYLLPILNHPIKKIMTYGREINLRNIKIINKIQNRNLIFTGCSKDLITEVRKFGCWEVVYNAIPFKNYSVQISYSAEAPLIFLGRIEEVKGAHTAVEVARATGHRLILAGNVSPLENEREYFKKRIQPYIDNKQIFYVGPLNDFQKNKWLRSSKALLFPIEWDEPFGMVMVEAMACGTPVIAFNRGSVPEVIDEGITGFITETKSEMIEVVSRLNEIKRDMCCSYAKEKFNVPFIALRYLGLHTLINVNSI